MRDLRIKEQDTKMLEMVVLLTQLKLELRHAQTWFDRAVDSASEVQEIIMDMQDNKGGRSL